MLRSAILRLRRVVRRIVVRILRLLILTLVAAAQIGNKNRVALLREKLTEGEKLGWQIKTVWGVGYKFEVK